MMSEREFRLLPIVAAFVLSFGMAACEGESQADADATGESSMAAETGDHAEAGGGVEAGGEDARVGPPAGVED